MTTLRRYRLHRTFPLNGLWLPDISIVLGSSIFRSSDMESCLYNPRCVVALSSTSTRRHNRNWQRATRHCPTTDLDDSAKPTFPPPTDGTKRDPYLSAAARPCSPIRGEGERAYTPGQTTHPLLSIELHVARMLAVSGSPKQKEGSNINGGTRAQQHPAAHWAPSYQLRTRGTSTAASRACLACSPHAPGRKN